MNVNYINTALAVFSSLITLVSFFVAMKYKIESLQYRIDLLEKMNLKHEVEHDKHEEEHKKLNETLLNLLISKSND